MANTALEGVKVLEYAQFIAGPFACKLMADFGAEVIKIEPPDGDMARQRGPFLNDVPDPECSGLFLYLNTNKKGITLNLGSAKGREILKKLVKEADILVEGAPPSEKRRLGLDYKTLKKINPKLIVASVTPFGQTGPYRNYKADYMNLSHGGGPGYLTPFDSTDSSILERAPVRECGAWGEYDCGVLLSVGLTAMLRMRRVTGKGEFIDMSRQEAIINVTRSHMTAYFDDGHSISRVDPTAFSAAPGIYRCQDGYVYIGASEDQQWQGLIEFMGNPEWAKAPQFGTDERRKHGVEIYQHVAPWALQHKKEEIFHGLQTRKCPSAPLNTIKDVVEAEYSKYGLFEEVDHPRAGRLSYPRAPVKFSESPTVLKSGAPLLGEHNQEVYCNKLGYSLPELVALRRTGVI